MRREVLVWKVKYAEFVKNRIWHKRPDHVNDKHEGREHPAKESVQLDDGDVCFLVFAGNLVNLLELPLFVLDSQLMQVLIVRA